VEVPKDTSGDAPAARQSEPAESLKSKVESPADAGMDALVAPAAPEQVASCKSPVESPSDTGGDALVASAPEQVASRTPPVESQKAIVDADVLSAADGDGAVATQGEGPASSGPNGQPDEPTNRPTDAPADDESLLGELFDLVARKRSQRSDESSTDKHEVKDESSVKISLPASSWDDAPLEEDGDFWQRLNSYKLKYWKVGAAIAGLWFLAVIVFAVVTKFHAKPEKAEPPVVSQTTVVSEPQPEPAPAAQSTPTPTPTPTPTLNSNSQPATPSAEAATAASSDGRTVYTANLIPPPDSYVE
jgi:hypothetical protein